MAPISDDLRREAWLAESRQPLVCLEITHASLPVAIRVVNNTQNVRLANTDTENDFIAFAFEIALPDQLEDSPPSCKLKIDNVDGVIAESLRSISTPASVKLLVVRVVEDAPAATDTVLVDTEIEFPIFKLSNVSIDALTVQGTLTVENLVREPFPCHVFSPAEFPGLI